MLSGRWIEGLEKIGEDGTKGSKGRRSAVMYVERMQRYVLVLPGRGVWALDM